MEITLLKKTICHLLVFLWIVFSLTYIAWDLWGDFKNIQMFQAYEQGRADTVSILIEEAEKCEPVQVTGRDKQISVIGVHCLTEVDESL